MRHLAEVQEARHLGTPELGRLLLVEHTPPVITVSRRAGAADHLLASREILGQMGIEVCETDRGGDITYHGPGQLVAYPILDLNAWGLSLHAYMRLLEQVVMDVCRTFGVETHRDPTATGVWVGRDPDPDRPSAKVAAMGVRVKRWVSMHGLALNVATNLDHFALIVPCGLAGRGVTSLRRELGANCPTIDRVKAELVRGFERAAHAVEQTVT